MEQEAPRKLMKSHVAASLTFGLIWGISVALSITVSNRHQFGHWDSGNKIVGRFIVFVVVGALGTIIRRIFFPTSLAPPRTPAGARIRLALFFGLMFGLACVLWRMF